MEISRFEKAAIKRTAQNTKALRTKRDKLQEKAEALISEIELLQNQIEAFDAPWKQKYNMSVEEIIASWDNETPAETPVEATEPAELVAPVAEESAPQAEDNNFPFNI